MLTYTSLKDRPRDFLVANGWHFGLSQPQAPYWLVNGHTRKVAYLGPTVAGKTHGKKAADED